jgi:hypothetical protein
MDAANDPGPIVAIAPDWEAFDKRFDDGYGGSEGPAVLAWTEQRVYFPAVYDGMEWLGSAPRNPTESGQGHTGGE